MHALGFGLSRIPAGLGRIAEVCGGAAEIQGLEPGSSPTSGTCFPCSGAFWCCLRVDSVHPHASDLMFRVCGVPDLFGCVGEQLSTAGRIPPCGVSSERSSSFVLPLGFRVHHFMVARAACNMICRLLFGSTEGLRPVRNFRSDTCSCRHSEGTA